MLKWLNRLWLVNSSSDGRNKKLAVLVCCESQYRTLWLFEARSIWGDFWQREGILAPGGAVNAEEARAEGR